MCLWIWQLLALIMGSAASCCFTIVVIGTCTTMTLIDLHQCKNRFVWDQNKHKTANVPNHTELQFEWLHIIWLPNLTKSVPSDFIEWNELVAWHRAGPHRGVKLYWLQQHVRAPLSLPDLRHLLLHPHHVRNMYKLLMPFESNSLLYKFLYIKFLRKPLKNKE